MAIQLFAADNISEGHGVKVLVFSRAGIGKTCLTATAPNPVLISAESGVLSLRKANLERVFGIGDPSITYTVPVIQIQSLDDLIEAEVWARTSAEAGQFQTVCLDSITEIAENVLSNAKKTKNDQGKLMDPRQAYGKLIEQMTDVIKAFRDLSGKHVYMSAKEERIKDESTGVTLTGPAMPGSKLGPALSYLFDEAFYLGIGKDSQTQKPYRFLRTCPDHNIDAKDRSGALDELEYPHLGNIFNKIMASSAIQP